MNSRSFAGTCSLPLLACVVLGAYACAPEATESEGASNAALAVAPVLGTARGFAVLGASTVTNTGPTVIDGDLGVSPGLAITGFPPGIVTGGAVHAGDAVALQAQIDVGTAYDALAAQPCSVDLSGTDLAGLRLKPGVYCFASSAQLSGALVLDAEGRTDAVFVFKIASTLTTASNASVSMVGGGTACGVFWQIGSSATLGTGTVFAGSVLALASISLTTGAKVSGRTIARTGAVTLDANAVSIPVCAVAPADAGGADAARPDAAPADASPADAAPADAAKDSSVPTPDAGPPVDSGTGSSDAGSSDAGAGDTGT